MLISLIFLALGIECIYEGPPYVYENKDVLPRSYWVKYAKKFKDDNKILSYMTKKEFNPKREVILKVDEEKEELYFTPPEGGEKFNPHAKIIEYKLNSVTIVVDAPTSGYLFLSDTYYPGWEAYVNGKKTKIYRANYCFRAVKVPKGRHIVYFVYRPKSFYIGCIASLLSFTLIMAYLIYSWRKERILKRASTNTNTV